MDAARNGTMTCADRHAAIVRPCRTTSDSTSGSRRTTSLSRDIPARRRISPRRWTRAHIAGSSIRPLDPREHRRGGGERCGQRFPPIPADRHGFRIGNSVPSTRGSRAPVDQRGNLQRPFRTPIRSPANAKWVDKKGRAANKPASQETGKLTQTADNCCGLCLGFCLGSQTSDI
jgi:hypothetical protein